MPFLRLAVNCAVFDDRQHVLVSRRGDMNIWNLPSGRVDSGELLADAAAREVREETGIVAHVERAVGLYYLQSWSRLNVFYTAEPEGGVLVQRTDETRANGFFPPTELPQPMINAFLVQHALTSGQPLLQTIVTPPREYRRVQLRLRWRWLMNLLHGRPEPRYVRFEIVAVGIIWDETHHRILTLPGERMPQLPRARCDGTRAPWEHLNQAVRATCGLEVSWQWVGLWQDTDRDRLELIFAATANKSEANESVAWLNSQNNLLSGRDAVYVERVKPGDEDTPVWTIARLSDDGDTVRT